MCSAQRLEPDDLTLELHAPEYVRIAGHQRFCLGSRKHHVVDVFDDPDRNGPPKHCLETASFGLDRLEDVAVEAPLGKIDEDADSRTRIDNRAGAVKDRTVDFVALPQSAAFS